jgi:site-specific DNA-cytosine methylase
MGYMPWRYNEVDIEKDIPDTDILCGGFQCQTFSQHANKRGSVTRIEEIYYI